MNDGELVRLKFYKGQVLTARDFNDQQEYHREKQRYLLRRFPPGIIEGLGVECVKKGSDLGDFDAFLIAEGLAVDPDGNQIIVPEGGVKVNVEGFKPEAPYLSLRYLEKEEVVGDGLCGTNQKNNRINESFETSWDKAPNIESNITVALIELKEGKEFAPNCDVLNVILEEKKGGPRIRLEARVVDTDQISDKAITEKKLDEAVVAKLVTGGNTHDHTGGHGALIPEAGLAQAVVDKLVTGGDGHDHTNGHGAPIPEGGLKQEVQDKLVTGGDGHDHTNGNGAPIPEGGLAQAVVDKLVSGGDTHNHSGGDGAVIPESGLDVAVKAKLVTSGNSHDHSGGDGALIPETGLEQAVKNKLVTNGNSHDHAGGDGALIPETGLENAVRAKLVTGGDSHTHVGSGGLIPETGLEQAVKDKLVTSGNSHDHTGGDGAPIKKDALDLITELPGNPTLDPGLSSTLTFNNVPTNALIQVIPTDDGELSWTFTVAFASSTRLTYRITVTNVGTIPVGFKVRAIAFGPDS